MKIVRSFIQSLSVAGLVAFMALSLTSCTGDEKKPEEAVSGANTASSTNSADSDAHKNFVAETVYFDFDRSDLTSESQSKLNNLAEHLKSNGAASVKIAGHCDERGTPQYNLALGERRAHSVKSFLVNLGVDANRLSTISYGEEKPVALGHDEAAWAQNRRAEFDITGAVAVESAPAEHAEAAHTEHAGH